MKTVICLALAATMSIPIGAELPGPQKPPTITVEGTAKLQLACDQARIKFTVVSKADTAAEAESLHNARFEKLTRFFDEVGIAESKILVGHLTLRPIYHSKRRGRRKLVAFEASQKVDATLVQLERYKELVVGGVDLGLNDIWDIDFVRSDLIEKRKEARIEAIRAAHQKAKYLTSTIDQSVGPAIEIVELDNRKAKSSSFGSNFNFSNSYEIEGLEGEVLTDSKSPGIPDESITVESTVRVVFLLNQE